MTYVRTRQYISVSLFFRGFVVLLIYFKSYHQRFPRFLWLSVSIRTRKVTLLCCLSLHLSLVIIFIYSFVYTLCHYCRGCKRDIYAVRSKCLMFIIIYNLIVQNDDIFSYLDSGDVSFAFGFQNGFTVFFCFFKVPPVLMEIFGKTQVQLLLLFLSFKIISTSTVTCTMGALYVKWGIIEYLICYQLVKGLSVMSLNLFYWNPLRR